MASAYRSLRPRVRAEQCSQRYIIHCLTLSQIAQILRERERCCRYLALGVPSRVQGFLGLGVLLVTGSQNVRMRDIWRNGSQFQLIWKVGLEVCFFLFTGKCKENAVRCVLFRNVAPILMPLNPHVCESGQQCGK